MRSVDDTHRQVHALARELCAWRRSGRQGDALARLPELHALRDALLAQLQALLAARCVDAHASTDEGRCAADLRT